MRRRFAEFQAEGGAVIAISFESRQRIFQLARQTKLPFPVLSDPERDVYRAYGLQSAGLWQVLAPGTFWAYVKLLARGRRYHFRRGDFRQLGGDFVIDAEGIIRFEHRGAAPHDRPAVDRLLERLAEV